jgi:putative PIN family toxin of toxin-antitoxin system
MRVVLDTNVVVSGLFWSGAPERILKLWSHGKFTLLLSRKVFDEYRDVDLRLAQKYELPSGYVALQNIFLGSHLIEPVDVPTPPCDDPKDVMFLELAVAGKADYLVSGDKHLLKVGEYPGGRVVKPSFFSALFS